MKIRVKQPTNEGAVRVDTNEQGNPGVIYCSACAEPQFETPSGVTCLNGHGGAAGVHEDEVATYPWPKSANKPASPGLKRGPTGVTHAKAHAAGLKLALPPAPVDDRGTPLQPTLPRDIDVWTLDQLSRLYSEFSALASYAQVQVALADIDRGDAKTFKEQTAAMLVLRGEGEGANATERKAAVEMHPDVVAASEVYRVANAKYVLLDSLFQGYDRGMRTVSREYSRRGLGIER